MAGLTAPEALKILRIIWGMAKIGNHELTQPERAILTILLLRVGSDGTMWPIGIRRLAEFAGVSKSKAQDVVRDLLAAGVLERTDSGERGKRARYRVNLHPIQDNAAKGTPIARPPNRKHRKSVRSRADTSNRQSVQSGADTSSPGESSENRPGRTLVSSLGRTPVSALGRTRSDDVNDEVLDDEECKNTLGSPIGSPLDVSLSLNGTKNDAAGETEAERRDRLRRMAHDLVAQEAAKREQRDPYAIDEDNPPWALVRRKSWFRCTMTVNGRTDRFQINTTDEAEAHAKAAAHYRREIAKTGGNRA